MIRLIQLRAAFMMLVVLLSGCATTENKNGPDSLIRRIGAPPSDTASAGGSPSKMPETGDNIGVLGVSGPNVFLNGKQAQNGDLVKLGDTITTGKNSSGLIEFNDGGFFQLNENTDPIFLAKRLQEGYCLFVRILVGEAFLDKQNFCFESPLLEAVSHSRINIHVIPQETEVTVVKGNVGVVRPAQSRSVKAGQKFGVTKDGKVMFDDLSESQITETVSWRNNFTFQGWCCTDNKLHLSDRDQCTAGNFSFNKTLLGRSCAPKSQAPNLQFNIPFPNIRNRQPSGQRDSSGQSRDATGSGSSSNLLLNQQKE